MKVVIANPPWTVNGIKGVRAGSRWPHLKAPEEEGYMPFPFFLGYASNLLKHNNIETLAIDAIAEDLSYERFYSRVKKFNPDLILLEISTPSLPNDIEIISRLKKENKSKIAVAGMAHITEKILKDNKLIDFALFGEYELTLLELAQKVSPSKIKGLIFRKGSQIIKNEERPLHKNLDDFPWPYNEDLPMKKYHDCPGGIPEPSVQMWGSRGCPFMCTFCAWPQIMYKPHHYRIRGTKDIVDEMEFLKSKGFKSFYFDDDTFNVGKQRMIDLAKEITKRKLNMPWAIMARADLMDQEILQALKDSGLYALKYGVESSNQQLIDNCNKKLDIKKAEKNILLTQSMGIKVHLTFTFGLPGETEQTINDTIDFAIRMNPESVQFSITTPFPGTKLHQEMKEKNQLVSSSFQDFDGNFKSVIRNEHLTPEDLEAAVRVAYARWIKHKKDRENKRLNAIELFKECYDTHGLKYTLKKTGSYILEGKLWQKNNHQNLYVQSIKKNKPLIGPEYVTIDITNKCNLNCIACWTFSPHLKQSPDEEWHGRQMDFHVFKKLIFDLDDMGTREIRLTGGGEPFMHPQIWEILRLVKEQGMKLDITTNFTLLNKEKIEWLAGLQIDNITISLWAGDKETYAKTHPNQTPATFDRIKENIEYFKSLNQKTKIVIANVITNKNYENIEGMIKFAEKVGANEVYFTFIDPIKGSTDILLLNEQQQTQLINQIKIIKEKTYKVKLDNIENVFRRISNKDATKGSYDTNMLPGMKCYTGWVFSRILANGDVAPCCRGVEHLVGNIYKNSFKEIWEGKKQTKFRKDGLNMYEEFTQKIGCHKTCDNWWQNKQVAQMLKEAEK